MPREFAEHRHQMLKKNRVNVMNDERGKPTLIK